MKSAVYVGQIWIVIQPSTCWKSSYMRWEVRYALAILIADLATECHHRMQLQKSRGKKGSAVRVDPKLHN